MTLFPTAPERGAGTTHRLYPRPPSPTSRQRLFVWSVFWLQLQLSRRRSLSEEDSEEGDVRKIRARRSSSGGSSRRKEEEEGFFRFTSQEEQRGRVLKKKAAWKRGEGVGYREQRERSRGAASLLSENGAARRGRARLCGGEHREEAQQKGWSQEHRKARLHASTWINA